MDCTHKCPAIRLVMFPKDTNPWGSIFGGVILSNIDIAASVATRSITRHRAVTVCMKEVVFKQPVKVGDILTFWTDVIKVGRTSVTIRVKVEAERHGETIPVTEGEVIFVAVDDQDRPIPLDSPIGTQGVELVVEKTSDEEAPEVKQPCAKHKTKNSVKAGECKAKKRQGKSKSTKPSK